METTQPTTATDANGDHSGLGSQAAMTPAALTERVLSSFDPSENERLVHVMRIFVRHLHDAVVEADLSMEEWQRGIEFLTAVGHKTDQHRQEFILLSDTLGVTSMVDLVDHRKPPGATESTVLGPFYVPSSPEREFGASIADDDPEGTPLHVFGRVVDLEGNPISEAELDVWQTASTGFYAVQQPDEQPETNLRGRFRSDEEGRFSFRTTRPVAYQIPADGPVGEMLAATGRHPWRTAHIHVIASAAGHEPVTTHLFDSECPWIGDDTVFGLKDSLVYDFRRASTGDGLELEVDLVLAPSDRSF